MYLKEKEFNDELIIKTISINGSDYTKYDVNSKYFCLLPYLSVKVINSFTFN